MVIPITDEAVWLQALESLPVWTPSQLPALIVVPHPDDETLALGGLLASLRKSSVEVTVVAVTDGENAYEDNSGLPDRRRQEQTSALNRLGISAANIIRLGLPDSGLQQDEERLADSLRALVSPNTQLFAPWCGDFHPDHEACGRAAAAVAREKNAALVSYFFWTWHRGDPSTMKDLKLHKFMLQEDVMLAKQEALACHVSQLHHEPEPEILPENLLWPARMSFEVLAL